MDGFSPTNSVLSSLLQSYVVCVETFKRLQIVPLKHFLEHNEKYKGDKCGKDGKAENLSKRNSIMTNLDREKFLIELDKFIFVSIIITVMFFAAIHEDKKITVSGPLKS